jgi:hypothetical protein
MINVYWHSNISRRVKIVSKIGDYIIGQIEQGNFTVDHRGNYHVGMQFQDRKPRPTAKATTTDALRQDAGRREFSDPESQQVRDRDDQATNAPLSEEQLSGAPEPAKR